MLKLSKLAILRRGFTTSAPAISTNQTLDPEVAALLAQHWVENVADKATTPEGKGYAVQLISLISYYTNAPASSTVEPIEWDKWRSELHTPSLVDKIKENHDSLMQETYDNAPILQRVKDYVSPFEETINKEMHFHNMLWTAFYLDNLRLKVNLDYVPRLRDCNIIEKIDLLPGVETEAQRRFETHAFLPGALDDLPFENYLKAQFAWGKKVTTFYRHPSDDFRAFRATKNIFGR